MTRATRAQGQTVESLLHRADEIAVRAHEFARLLETIQPKLDGIDPFDWQAALDGPLADLERRLAEPTLPEHAQEFDRIAYQIDMLRRHAVDQRRLLVQPARFTNGSWAFGGHAKALRTEVADALARLGIERKHQPRAEQPPDDLIAELTPIERKIIEALWHGRLMDEKLLVKRVWSNTPATDGRHYVRISKLNEKLCGPKLLKFKIEIERKNGTVRLTHEN